MLPEQPVTQLPDLWFLSEASPHSLDESPLLSASVDLSARSPLRDCLQGHGHLNNSDDIREH